MKFIQRGRRGRKSAAIRGRVERLQVKTLEAGHIVTKVVNVPRDKRTYENIGDAKYAITPVWENGHCVGHAIESINPMNRGRVVRKDSSTIFVPGRKQQVYDKMALPDGIYKCDSCGNYVQVGHSCF